MFLLNKSRLAIISMRAVYLFKFQGTSQWYSSGVSSSIQKIAEAQPDTDEAWQTKVKQIKSITDSLAARGFCRPQKPYNPPTDVEDTIHGIAKSVLGEKLSRNWKKTPLEDKFLKYKFLTSCMKEIQHEVPNSQIHNIQTVNDAVNFFNTPVQGISPYDKLVNSKDELPKNLHVQAEAIRFNPYTDTFFGGTNAYPGRSSIITGLKAKKKYKGYEGRTVWDKV